MRVAIHHAAWHVCGGGELYVGALAEELAKKHETSLLLTTPFDRERLRELLGLRFENVRFVELSSTSDSRRLAGRRHRSRAERAVARALRDFDFGIRVATRKCSGGGSAEKPASRPGALFPSEIPSRLVASGPEPQGASGL